MQTDRSYNKTDSLSSDSAETSEPAWLLLKQNGVSGLFFPLHHALSGIALSLAPSSH